MRHDLIDVQRTETRRRPLHYSRVDLGDLDVERDDPTTDGRFLMELLDRGELLRDVDQGRVDLRRGGRDNISVVVAQAEDIFCLDKTQINPTL